MILKPNTNLYTRVPKANDIIMATANNVIKTDGALVMGAGAALSLKTMVGDDIDHLFGLLVSNHTSSDYYMLTHGNYGILQTKRHYKDPSDLALVTKSIRYLYVVANVMTGHTFHCNFPGIGYGGLSYDVVLELLEHLPDNVIIYTL